MGISIASIVVRNGKAYMPATGVTDSGLFMDTEPVLICDLSLKEMTENLSKIIEIGHPPIKVSSPEERKKHSDLMLKATGAKSWKELGITGFAYSIGWSDKGISIEMTRLDKKGRWEYDPSKARQLPAEATMTDIIQIILDDIRSRT